MKTELPAERHLPIEGGFNFRDLGGYETEDGRTVCWRKLFRSDDLGNLTEADLHYLAAIPIASVIDFRSEAEMNSLPDKLPEGATAYPLSLDPGNLSGAAAGGLDQLATLNMDNVMQTINVELVTNKESIVRYKEFFRLVQNADRVPLLFHCSAGKDRTGLGAALILYALGVDEETIMEDYLLSNKYLEAKYAPLVTKYPELKPLFSVKQEYLKAGIDRVKQEYGSVVEYLRQVLEVDVEGMKERFTE